MPIYTNTQSVPTASITTLSGDLYNIYKAINNDLKSINDLLVKYLDKYDKQDAKL